MTEIINGELVRNELSEKSMGGTELMALRMVRDIDPDLLKQFHIIHSRVRDIDPEENNILVLHDLPNDPESARLSDPEFRKMFKKLVFVSNWQLQYYNLVHGVPYSESVVIKNGIEPVQYGKMYSDGPVKLIYHTTPHRGLEILVPAFDYVQKALQENKGIDIELDVYSSFGVYGWESRDAHYKELFEKCKEHPKINYHGAVSNGEVIEALKNSHIFAYPNIWPETSCIAAIEAMQSYNIIVAPNLAALPETTGGFASMYQYDEDMNTHANRFSSVLYNTVIAVKEDRGIDRVLRFQREYSMMNNHWPTLKGQWESMLRGLI